MSGHKAPRPPRRRSLLRTIRGLAVGLLAVALFYPVVVNVILSTPLFGMLANGTPDVVDIHYARAWSLFPTRVHAQGLSIRGTDSHVEWILRLDDVDFDCSLLGLAKKQFHVSRARGTGVSFRVRMKVPPPGATPEQQRWLPPIDSLGPVGVIPEQKYGGTWDDADWALWTIHLEDVVAEHVREVWIDGGRFEGDARVAGGFYLKPIRAVEVGPAHVEVRRGQMAFQGDTLAAPIAASVDFKLDRFDPRVITDATLAHLISLSVDASTAVPDVARLPLHLPDGSTLGGRVDVPRLAVRLVKGIVRDGTYVDARAGRLDARVSGHALSASAVVAMDVEHDRLSAQGELDDVEAELGLSARRLLISADSRALDLAAPLGDLHAVADVQGAELRDAAHLEAFVPRGAPIRIVGGEAAGAAHLEGWRDSGRVKGRATMHAKGVDVLVAKRVRAQGSLDLVGSFGLETRHAAGVHGRAIHLDDVRLDATHVTVMPATPSAAARPAVTIARVSISTSSPRFMLSDPLARVQIVANVQGGRLGDATALRDLLPAGTIQLTSDGEGRFDGDAAAEIRRHVARGAGSIRTHGIGFAAKKIHAIGDVAFVANVADWNLARRTLTGDVRVVAENVTGGFDPNAPAPEMIAGRIVARVSARELDLSHPELRAGDFALEVDRARLPDARALNAFLPSPRILAIESGSALVSAKIDTARTDHAGEADLRVWLPGASIRFHETRLAGDVLVDVKARAPLDHAPSEIDLEGSQVAMRNVRVTDSATDTAAWSGDFVLQEGSLRLDPTPRFAGSLSLRARDASPLLAILLRGTLPNLLAKLTRMPELTAATDFVVEPDALVVTNLLASGADLSVLGTYALRGDERSAAFVVQKGPWSVGVRLDDAGTHVRFFGLNRWYAEQRNEALRLVTFRVPR